MSSGSTFWLVSEIQSAIDAFATAGSDPLSAVLLLFGGLLTAGASLAFGGVVAGGLLDVVGDAVSRSPPEPE